MNRRSIASFFSISLFLIIIAGCAGPSANERSNAQAVVAELGTAATDIWKADKAASAEIAKKECERVYPAAYDVVFDGVVKALGKNQCLITTADKPSGFISADEVYVIGKQKESINDQMHQRNDDKTREIWARHGFIYPDQLNRTYVYLNYLATVDFGDTKLNITISKIDANKTSVRMMQIYGDQCWFPPYVEAVYTNFWKSIDAEVPQAEPAK